MLINRIVYPLYTLGPGKRIGIWTSGCTHGCKNCMTEEYWAFDNKKVLNISDFIEKIGPFLEECEGVTISGGDPFMQPDLWKYLVILRELGIKDILVYTGYTHQQLIDFKSHTINVALKNIDVLIDGLYIDELNDNQPLRGSSNQKIIYLNNSMEEKYKEYLKNTRKLQIEVVNDYVYHYGIPNKNVIKKIAQAIKKINS